METLDLFKEVIKWQIDRYEQRGLYAEESTAMVELARLTNATEFIDFGMWGGLLAKEIFKRMPELEHYFAVDAVPLYLELAKETINDPRFHTTQVLLYNKHSAEYKNSFTVDIFNSLASSSIYTGKSRRVDLPHLIDIPAAQPEYVHQFLYNHSELLRANSYVKIDVDGIDVSLTHHYLNRILQTGIKPKVLQFEFWHIFNSDWNDLADKIRLAGYVVPEFNFTDDTIDYFSLATSTTDWWYWYALKESREQIMVKSWS